MLNASLKRAANIADADHADQFVFLHDRNAAELLETRYEAASKTGLFDYIISGFRLITASLELGLGQSVYG